MGRYLCTSMSGFALPLVEAESMVRLSTEATVVEWPEPIPRAATLTAKLGDRWIRGQLWTNRLTGRVSIRIPPTGLSGVLVVRPFWVNEDDGPAAPVDPAGPPRRVLYLKDPVLCEEAALYLGLTCTVQRGVRGARDGPSVMGMVGNIRTLVGNILLGNRDDGEVRSQRASGHRSSVSGSDHDDRHGNDRENDHDENTAVLDAKDDDIGEDSIAARTRSGRRKQRATPKERQRRWSTRSSADDCEDRALVDLASLLFEDDCDANALMDGCELAGGQGLLHLLNAFACRLLEIHADAGDEIDQALKTSLTERRFGKSRVMNEVAAYGCPDTLWQLFELIGNADDAKGDLGERLFGGVDMPVDDKLWTPLHTAAAASAEEGEDSTGGAAAELVKAMIGGCKDPHAWMKGVAKVVDDEGDGEGLRAEQYRASAGFQGQTLSQTDSDQDTKGSRDQRSQDDERPPLGSMKGLAPPPHDLAGADTRRLVHDLYESAAELAVSALGAVATACAEPFFIELNQTVLENALQRVITCGRDPTLTYIASLILQDDQCWATFSYVYSLTRGPAQVWLAFPLAESVDATMRCLGFESGTGPHRGTGEGGAVLENSPIGDSPAHAAEASKGAASEMCSDVAEAEYRQEVVAVSALRLKETKGLEPLVCQTPWNTRGLMRFEDPVVEDAFRSLADEITAPAVNAGLLAAFVLIFVCAMTAGYLTTLELYSNTEFPSLPFGSLMIMAPVAIMGVFQFQRQVRAGLLAACFLIFVCVATAGYLTLLEMYVSGRDTEFPSLPFSLLMTMIMAPVAIMGVLQSVGISHRARMGCISVFRLALAAVSVKYGSSLFDDENLTFDADGFAIVPNETRSAFDPDAFNDQFGVKTAVFFVMTTIVLPHLMPLRFGEQLVTSFLCGCVAWARFGSFFALGGMEMFRSEKDLMLRCAMFAATQVPMYIREYHLRFRFLMGKFGRPGNKLEKQKVF
mgnify:FL=1